MMNIPPSSMYQRTALLVGEEGIETLKTKTVAVFGCGGVGGTAVEMLVRTGIGRIVLVDFDTFDETNLNRQILATRDKIETVKLDAAVERIQAINPDCEVITHPVFFDETQWERVFSTPIDFVVDAIDSVPAKFFLLKSCYEKRIPVISSMGAGNKLDPSQVQIADISKTRSCGLAKVIRHKLREAGINRGIPVVFSTEVPVPLPHLMTSPADERRKKKLIGSISYMPSLFGLHAAGYVIRKLLNLVKTH